MNGEADRRATRRREIERLAVMAATSPDAGALDEDELYDAAAMQLSGRRAERGDLVGALIWEAVARREQPAPIEEETGDDRSVPAHRSRPDQRDGA